jgi:hypothetical protein
MACELPIGTGRNRARPAGMPRNVSPGSGGDEAIGDRVRLQQEAAEFLGKRFGLI